jgi:hypothetical protein
MGLCLDISSLFDKLDPYCNPMPTNKNIKLRFTMSEIKYFKHGNIFAEGGSLPP